MSSDVSAKSTPNPNPNPNPTTKQHAIVNIHVLRIQIHSYETMLLHRLYYSFDCNCHTATWCGTWWLTIVSTRARFRNSYDLRCTDTSDCPLDISAPQNLFTNCLVYREIKTGENQVTLQRDLSALVTWAKIWGMQFNPAKCNVMRIHRLQSPFLRTCVLWDNSCRGWAGQVPWDHIEW